MKVKNITVNSVDAEIVASFKIMCLERGVTMRDMLIKLITDETKKHKRKS
jgi:hypothetical protein